MKKIIALMLTLCLIVGLAAGCGSDTTSGEKTWVVATDTVFKPFEYTDKDNNFVGIDVDIMKAVAEDQGFKYELKSLGWDAAIAACKAGQADAMIAGASITDKRKNEGWIFSDGYYTATQCMTVQADSTITKFDDLKGKTVAVKTGTSSVPFMKDFGKAKELKQFPNNDGMFFELLSKGVDAVVFDMPVVTAFANSAGKGQGRRPPVRRPEVRHRLCPGQRGAGEEGQRRP